jgi:hypothetical protein
MATHNPKRLHPEVLCVCHSVVWHCIHPYCHAVSRLHAYDFVTSSYRLQNWTKRSVMVVVCCRRTLQQQATTTTTTKHTPADQLGVSGRGRRYATSKF